MVFLLAYRLVREDKAGLEGVCSFTLLPLLYSQGESVSHPMTFIRHLFCAGRWDTKMKRALSWPQGAPSWATGKETHSPYPAGQA